MFLLRSLAAFVKKQKNLKSDLVGIADEFGSQLFNELNYFQEARNCRRFKQLYGKIPGIYVPDVYYPLTGKRVLTMEFVEGTKGPWEKGEVLFFAP
jgi:predicted unusual protein kinase regulating ubiquinone biosynthesis (AarF/ABC1/UbiB family)